MGATTSYRGDRGGFATYAFARSQPMPSSVVSSATIYATAGTGATEYTEESTAHGYIGPVPGYGYAIGTVYIRCYASGYGYGYGSATGFAPGAILAGSRA